MTKNHNVKPIANLRKPLKKTLFKDEEKQHKLEPAY
jgi:hypothetical protein